MKRYYALKVVVTGQLMVLASFISGIAYYLHRNIPVYYDNAVVWFLKTIYCSIHPYYDNAVVWFLKIMDSWPKW